MLASERALLSAAIRFAALELLCNEPSPLIMTRSNRPGFRAAVIASDHDTPVVTSMPATRPKF